MLRMIIFFNSRVRWQGGERPVLAVTRGVPFGCLTHWGFWCLVLCFMPLIAKSCSFYEVMTFGYNFYAYFIFGDSFTLRLSFNLNSPH